MLIEQEEGSVVKQTCPLGAFKRDRGVRVDGLRAPGVALAVMQSTAIEWKSPYTPLERAGIATLGIDARPGKQGPGRPMLALGAMAWQLHPPADLRPLRLLSRYRPNWGDARRREEPPAPMPACAWERCGYWRGLSLGPDRGAAGG